MGDFLCHEKAPGVTGDLRGVGSEPTIGTTTRIDERIELRVQREHFCISGLIWHNGDHLVPFKPSATPYQSAYADLAIDGPVPRVEDDTLTTGLVKATTRLDTERWVCLCYCRLTQQNCETGDKKFCFHFDVLPKSFRSVFVMVEKSNRTNCK